MTIGDLNIDLIEQVIEMLSQWVWKKCFCTSILHQLPVNEGEAILGDLGPLHPVHASASQSTNAQ